MTIKQQGGIFGRNPTFNDVEVEGNLTVGGSAVSGTGTIASQDADSVNIDGGNIDGTTIGGSTPAAGSFTTFTSQGIDDNSTSTSLVIASNSNVTIQGPSPSGGGVLNLENTTTAVNGQDWGSINFISNDSSSGASGIRASIVATSTSFNGDGNIVFSTAASSGVNTEHMRLNAAGNLAFANGKGIDFSLTSGTGTSELFDDYEEGTWTPRLDGSGGASGQAYSSQTGDYTKIGDTVFVTGYVQLSTEGTVSGWARLSGLPYTPSKNGAGVASYIANMSVTDGLFLDVRSDGNVYLHTQDVTAIAGSTLFTNTSAMKFSLTYKV